MREVICVDLDGTLIFEQPAEFYIKNRVSISYLSAAAVAHLAHLSRTYPIVIATARQINNIRPLMQHLASHIHFGGFITENGLCYRHTLEEILPPSPLLQAGRDLHQVLPQWERLNGYENCCGFIPPAHLTDPIHDFQSALTQLQLEGVLWQDRHKLFFYPHPTHKQRGVEGLGVIGKIMLGNDLNDKEILAASTYSITLQTAHPEIRALVMQQGGYCSPYTGHAAAADMLEHARGWLG